MNRERSKPREPTKSNKLQMGKVEGVFACFPNDFSDTNDGDDTNKKDEGDGGSVSNSYATAAITVSHR